MASWDDVARACLALPGTAESTSYRNRSWAVRGKSFVWERPLGKKDLAELGDAAPSGPVLGVRVPDVGVKEALLAEEPGTCFTTSHFDGYPAVLVRLDELGPELLEELVEEAWASMAPKRLLAEHRPG
jgi:hypothetical protein